MYISCHFIKAEYIILLCSYFSISPLSVSVKNKSHYHLDFHTKIITFTPLLFPAENKHGKNNYRKGADTDYPVAVNGTAEFLFMFNTLHTAFKFIIGDLFHMLLQRLCIRFADGMFIFFNYSLLYLPAFVNNYA